MNGQKTPQKSAQVGSNVRVIQIAATAQDSIPVLLPALGWLGCLLQEV